MNSAALIKGRIVTKPAKMLLADLEKDGYLVGTEPYAHNVGQCYRCKTDIEPMVSKQWFVKIKPLAKQAIAAVVKGKNKNYSQIMGSHLF